MIRRRTFLGSLLGGAALLSVPPFIGSLTQNAYSATEPVKGGTLNVGLHIPLPTLDWQSTVGHPLPHVMGHVFEGLTGQGKDLNAEPELAETIEAAADGRTWTFKLRSGVKFHNGKTLEAADVQASLERWRKVGPKGSGLESLAAIETPSADTVILKFNSAMGRYLL